MTNDEKDLLFVISSSSLILVSGFVILVYWNPARLCSPALDERLFSRTMLSLPIGILILSWLVFCCGAAAEVWTLTRRAAGPLTLLCLGVVPVLSWDFVSRRCRAAWPRWSERLTGHTAAVDALPSRYDWLWIALSACVGLYLELVMIRFHASCFQLFAFFKNLSLLSCFLGLGIGYAAGEKRTLLTPIVLPLLAVQLLLFHALRFTNLAEILHNPLSDHIALGLDESGTWVHAMTAYGFLFFVFCLNALAFIPLGQLAARCMARQARLSAYGWNLLGSLTGIGAFYLVSYACAPPAVWVALGAAGLLIFLPPFRGASAGIALLAVGALATNFTVNQYDLYSPYQILSVTQGTRPYPEIRVNHVYYQQIFKLDEPAHEWAQVAANYYNLPYLIQGSPEDVLVVGSGTGNDVASAVRHGAGNIDAVEIDPLILRLGEKLHPEQPYASPRVHAHVNDARNFIRGTDRKYDLIVYGLLDSHTLLSGLSAVRLDSYIYTVEAFREARARLKPGGRIFLSFAMIKGELGRKLYLMLREAFDGQPPLALRTMYDGGVTFVAGEQLDPRSILPKVPADILDVTSILAGTQFASDVSTDDWPFFYMPHRQYPLTYAAMVVAILLVSTVYVRKLLPWGTLGWRKSVSVPCFFLGAGFMLLETKAVTELALFFGGTWVVVGIVISAILVMAFLANFLLMSGLNLKLPLVYLMLLLSIGVRLIIPTTMIGGGLHGELVATFLLTIPLFFAGLAFSSELRSAPSIGAALSSNLLGAMLGGCLEFNSMYFGFRSLYFLALGLYATAFVASLFPSGAEESERVSLLPIPAHGAE